MPSVGELSKFLAQDYSKSFWNGKGTFQVLSGQFLALLQQDPGITIGAVRQALSGAGKPPLVQTGLNFDVDAKDPLRLGTKAGGDGISVAFTAHADVGARVSIVLAPDGLSALEEPHPADLASLLREHTALRGGDALVVLTSAGEADAAFASSVLDKPGVNVGVSFKAGAGVDWACCRLARDDERLLDVLRLAFASARLPQSDPAEVAASGRAVSPGPNEILFSQFTGFVTLGGEATVGYDLSGAKQYQIGKLDLASTLVVKAQAKVNASFGLAGAFRILVLPGKTPGWVRVVVEKNHSSTFDFALGVAADARLATSGLPASADAPLALLESVLGFRTPQVAQQVLAIAALPPEQLRQQIDASVKALAEAWAGKAFDRLVGDGELGSTIEALTRAARLVTGADDRIVSLYEAYVARPLEAPLAALGAIVEQASLETQRQQLLQKIGDEDIRQLVGALAGRAFGQVVVSYEQVAGELRDQVRRLQTFVQSEGADSIRKFIQAKKQALGLAPVFDLLSRLDTPAKLKQSATLPVAALVERLTGRALDALLASADAAAAVREVNAVARQFDESLRRINDVIVRALNAQGRLEIGWAYQRVRAGEKLVDLQVRVEPGSDALRAQAFQVLRDATHGRFDAVLTDDNAPLIDVASAAFTDALTRVGTLKVNVFGWNYKEVSRVLSKLDACVTQRPTGLVTMYNVGTTGESLRECQKSAVALRYVFQVAGQVAGAFEADEKLRRSIVDVSERLSNVQSELDYRIADPLTSLDELRLYLSVGRQLGVLDAGQTARLIASIQELRRPSNGAPAAMAEGAFKRLGVSYTVGFAGAALARALTTDLTGIEVEWWTGDGRAERRPVVTKATDHQMALQAIYIDRLIASFIVGRSPDRISYAIPALYRAGIHLAFLENPTGVRADHWRAVSIRGADGEVATVTIPPVAVEWARRHYFVNVALAKFLDGFRRAVAARTRQPLGMLEAFLKSLTEDLMAAGEGEQAVLPFLLLDELVRRTHVGEPTATRALLEITLFDDRGQPANYIPIVA